jgi:PIN domain nuclease of toxin-antitoxin system
VALRFLLDTHILIRCVAEPNKLSRDQLRVIERAAERNEPVAISAVTLLEIALLLSADRLLNLALADLLREFETRPPIRILPVTLEVASEVTSLVRTLRDPFDCTIVATARVHGLRLLTSDQRILRSKLVPVIE